MESLYCTSPTLRNLLIETSGKIACNVEYPIRLVEYIVLPDFGQRVILRFEFSDERKVPFEEADRLESRLRNLAGSDYWVTLTGSCYQHFPTDLAQKQISIDHIISSDVLQFLPTCHSDAIQRDEQHIRDRLKLTAASLVWEIELPVPPKSDDPVIRIIEPARNEGGQSIPRQMDRLSIGSEDFYVEYFTDDPSFIGLVKAYFMAEQKHMALASYVAQFGTR